MNNPFDVSDGCRQTLDDVIRRNSFFSSDSANDVRSRRGAVDRIISQISSFSGRKLEFNTTFDQGIVGDRNYAALFLGIANAICRNSASEFHAIGFGPRFHNWEKHGTYVCTWRYAHFEFTAFTKPFPGHHKALDWHIRVIDLDRTEDDDDDSGNDTDTVETNTTGRLHYAYSTLKGMHDRLTLLETCLNRRGTTTAFRPRLQ
jgi:hypothetical protein